MSRSFSSWAEAKGYLENISVGMPLNLGHHAGTGVPGSRAGWATNTVLHKCRFPRRIVFDQDHVSSQMETSLAAYLRDGLSGDDVARIEAGCESAQFRRERYTLRGEGALVATMDAVLFEPVNRISLDINASRNAARSYATRSGRHYQVNSMHLAGDDTEQQSGSDLPAAVIPDALGIAGAGPMAVGDDGNQDVGTTEAGDPTIARSPVAAALEVKLSSVLAPVADNLQATTMRGGYFEAHGEYVTNDRFILPNTGLLLQQVSFAAPRAANGAGF